MLADEYAYQEDLLGRLAVALCGVTEENLAAAAPYTEAKERYHSLLEVMRACGELDCYHDDYYIDPETGILCGRIGLRIPRYRD